jgi:hypothetical protein
MRGAARQERMRVLPCLPATLTQRTCVPATAPHSGTAGTHATFCTQHTTRHVATCSCCCCCSSAPCAYSLAQHTRTHSVKKGTASSCCLCKTAGVRCSQSDRAAKHPALLPRQPASKFDGSNRLRPRGQHNSQRSKLLILKRTACTADGLAKRPGRSCSQLLRCSTGKRQLPLAHLHRQTASHLLPLHLPRSVRQQATCCRCTCQGV